jgi:hypothetical protein
MIHRGELVKRAIKDSRISVSKIATALKVNRKTVYNLCEDPDAPLDYVIKIGKIIRYDFSNDLPELKKFNATESPVEYANWKDKYYGLLEEHTALLKKEDSAAMILTTILDRIGGGLDGIRNDFQHYFQVMIQKEGVMQLNDLNESQRKQLQSIINNIKPAVWNPPGGGK